MQRPPKKNVENSLLGDPKFTLASLSWPGNPVSDQQAYESSTWYGAASKLAGLWGFGIIELTIEGSNKKTKTGERCPTPWNAFNSGSLSAFPSVGHHSPQKEGWVTAIMRPSKQV